MLHQQVCVLAGNAPGRVESRQQNARSYELGTNLLGLVRDVLAERMNRGRDVRFRGSHPPRSVVANQGHFRRCPQCRHRVRVRFLRNGPVHRRRPSVDRTIHFSRRLGHHALLVKCSPANGVEAERGAELTIRCDFSPGAHASHVIRLHRREPRRSCGRRTPRGPRL